MTTIRILQIVSLFMIYIGITAFINPTPTAQTYEQALVTNPLYGQW